jgi:RNA-dependent RNA polymerase
MSKMRERTDFLYSSIRDEISADEDKPYEDSIKRAWYGYDISRKLGEKFGARSFGWICLGEIFDNIRAIESDERLF